MVAARRPPSSDPAKVQLWRLPLKARSAAPRPRQKDRRLTITIANVATDTQGLTNRASAPLPKWAPRTYSTECRQPRRLSA
jgi:hypothetical protein